MKKSIILSLALGTLALTSCNDYLDTLPDDRAEVNSVEKIKNLLVCAYPNHSVNLLMEYSTDNITDNGKQYSCAYQTLEKCYRWEQAETTNNDDPKSVWSNHYEVIAACNAALDGISQVGENEETKPLKAEALLCRAYAMFQLTNCFAMAYDPTKADQYLGIPYPKESGVSVDERGTLAETYANINDDIEAALPLLDDGYLSVPKYHFNAKAAYAFAARFNLYYHKYDKAVDYATKALGNDVASQLRNTSYYSTLGGAQAISDEYMRSSLPCNYMVITAYSLLGRTLYSSLYRRFAHNRDIIAYETFWAGTPWSSANSSSNTCLYEAALQYGTNQGVYYPKMIESFEYTDKVNGTGYAHTVEIAFTGDETLLVRAEAYTLLKQYDNALRDLNTWASVRLAAARGNARRPTLTTELINEFMDATPVTPVNITKAAERTIKKPLNPQGFTIEEGTQKNMLYLILHLRRIETFQQGQRFQDIKRYGMEFSHQLDGENAIVFKAGDLRGAIQLPIDVIDAGLPANPREEEPVK